MTDHECNKQVDRLERLERGQQRLYRIIFGNGGYGMKDELTQVKVSVRALSRVGWIVATAVIIQLVGVFFLLLTKLAGG